jgi:hypothetical protein
MPSSEDLSLTHLVNDIVCCLQARSYRSLTICHYASLPNLHALVDFGYTSIAVTRKMRAFCPCPFGVLPEKRGHLTGCNLSSVRHSVHCLL